MKDLVKETLEKIKNENIYPESKWKYLIKEKGIWMILLLILFVGAISLAVFFEIIVELDWDLHNVVFQNYFLYFFKIIPYFWIIILILFLILAYFDFRKTENGYKYNSLKIFSILFLIVILFGFISYYFNAGKKINSALIDNNSFYKNHIITKENQWTNPRGGFLSGEIISIFKDGLKIEDLNKKEWNIDFQDNIVIKNSVNIRIGEKIKIIGKEKIEEENKFNAIEIRPWDGKGKMNGKNND